MVVYKMYILVDIVDIVWSGCTVPQCWRQPTEEIDVGAARGCTATSVLHNGVAAAAHGLHFFVWLHCAAALEAAR